MIEPLSDKKRVLMIEHNSLYFYKADDVKSAIEALKKDIKDGDLIKELYRNDLMTIDYFKLLIISQIDKRFGNLK